MWIYIIIVVAIIFLLFVFITYNNLVKLNNKVEEAFSTMDVYLKKRWDLIPNIVEIVKGYSQHEKKSLHENKFTVQLSIKPDRHIYDVDSVCDRQFDYATDLPLFRHRPRMAANLLFHFDRSLQIWYGSRIAHSHLLTVDQPFDVRNATTCRIAINILQISRVGCCGRTDSRKD